MASRGKPLKLAIFKDFTYFASRPLSLQGDEWRALAFCDGGIRYLSVPLEGVNRCVYVHKVDLTKSYKKVLSVVLGDYKKHLQDYKYRVKNMRLAAENLSACQNLTNKRKADLFKIWVEALKNYYFPIVMPFAIEKFLDPECRLMLEKNYGEDEAREYMNIISSPAKLNDYQKLRLEMMELIIKNKINLKNLNKLAEKYYWYSEYSYTEPQLDVKYFKSEISKISRTEAIRERSKLLNEPADNLSAFLKLVKTLKNPKLQLIARVINDYTHIRTERMDELKKSMARVRLFYMELAKDLAKKSDLPWKYLNVVYLLNEEILLYLKNGKMPDYNESVKRIKNSYIFYFDGTARLISDKKVIKKILDIIKKSGRDDKIQGTVAYQGKVRGKVRVILEKKDLSNFKKGEIIVARSTMPDYTPFMKLAKAIITDEGGITCHAAIVSREMKIPCIVGAKIATQILKNGDLVEVDAERGIVKILKNN